MKIKKLGLAALLVFAAAGAGAQTLNVQSAIQDLKKNYLKKAKLEIDAACEHEATKDDAKTWCYKGLIYARIGSEASNPKSKFKDLAPDWAEQAYQAAMECKRLDANHEYANENNSVFRFVGNEYYSQSVELLSNQQYAEALEVAERAIEMFNNSGDAKFAGESMWIAGLSAKALKNNDKVKRYFSNLVRRKTNRTQVYRNLFNVYKEEGDKEGAMKTATNYMNNRPNYYDAYLLMAEGYLLNDNLEGGKDMINKALELTRDSVKLYPQILGMAALLLETTGDYEGAEAKYNESLNLTPVQFDANFGMGKMIFNRGVDKLDAANAIPPDDDSGLYDKLMEESRGFFGQSIQYFQAAVSYIDGLTDPEAKRMQRKNLYDSLSALNTVYARLEMYDELKAVKARLEDIQKEG
ncbi:MAG: hypothetical protein IJU19_04040 [Bacteroidales bacterium]|nr:hypothetical protein [Bacteroidales bacterium]